MVTLYTWFPSTPIEMVELGLLPDFGHSALQVIDDLGKETYASFWPGSTTIAGELTHHFVLPTSRYPATYLEEIDPHGHFMLRESERADKIEGLVEARILEAWEFLKSGSYDIRYWNCSDVTKLLILYAMDGAIFVRMQDAARLTVSDMRAVGSLQDLRAVLRYLATSTFIDSRPDDVVRLARVYNSVRAEAAGEQGSSPAP